MAGKRGFIAMIYRSNAEMMKQKKKNHHFLGETYSHTPPPYKRGTGLRPEGALSRGVGNPSLALLFQPIVIFALGFK